MSENVRTLPQPNGLTGEEFAPVALPEATDTYAGRERAQQLVAAEVGRTGLAETTAPFGYFEAVKPGDEQLKTAQTKCQIVNPSTGNKYNVIDDE